MSSLGEETIEKRVTQPDEEQVWPGIEDRVIAPRQGSRGTRSYASLDEMKKPTRGTNERKGGRPQAQENRSKMIQARKTLEKRDRVLTAAIRRCHVELAKRKSLWDIEASKDEVEAAWNEFNQANSRYCASAGWVAYRKEEQPEEVRRASYEWKVLTDMMEQVVDKAEEYLESATKEISCVELREDEDGGNELDAEMEVRLWVEQLSIMSKVNEMALEVSAANEMNANEVNDVNKVNEESTVNKDDCVVCNIKEVVPEMSYLMIKEVEIVTEAKEVCGVKEEMSKGKSLEIEAKVEVNEKSEEVVTAKPPDVLQRFDFTAKVQVEEFSMKVVKNSEEVKKSQEDKEVEILPLMKEVKESRHANWDPGELVDAKAQVEMSDAKEEILVNIGKVGLQLSVTEVRSCVGAIEKALLFLLFLLKARFVNGFSPLSVVELSDYG